MRRLSGTSDTAFVAGLSIPIPVFNQNQGEIARASAEVSRTLSEGRQAQIERSQQLIDAWNAWRTAWREIDGLKRMALPEAERAFRLAQDGYRAGAFEYLDVLDAQRAFFEAKTALLDALSRLQTARAQVQRLTGQITPTDARTP
jgi:cobalt-zinc-cadmium efflux system outer membrane protein